MPHDLGGWRDHLPGPRNSFPLGNGLRALPVTELG